MVAFYFDVHFIIHSILYGRMEEMNGGRKDIEDITTRKSKCQIKPLEISIKMAQKVV
jgi:hypothetical protein